jgi:hypothetical protein
MISIHTAINGAYLMPNTSVSNKSQFEKNFNEAFSQWITFAKDLKQLNKLEAHIAKYQKLFVPKNK